jgi:hypothetical protein
MNAQTIVDIAVLAAIAVVAVTLIIVAGVNHRAELRAETEVKLDEAQHLADSRAAFRSHTEPNRGA